jgi:SAM-dependent methyltransferase
LIVKRSLRGCPVCDNATAEVLHTQRFVLPQGHPLADGYDVVSCARCGFSYADTAVTQADYDRYYARFSKYEDIKTGTGGGETPWDVSRFAATANQIARYLENTQASILDIGCANGGLLKALHLLGFHNLCGVDPSSACVENVRRSGIEAHVGSLFEPLSAKRFDCLILSHVLEHVNNLKQAVQSLKPLLAVERKSRVYVEVPDASRYADYLFSPFQDFNTEHINHFSQIGLANLMQTAGFIVEEWGEKTIESSPNMPYPVLYGIWSEPSHSSRESAFERDIQLAVNLKRYIAESHNIMDGIKAKLRKTLIGSPQVIVWGTGQLALKLLAETSLAKAQIGAFVDGNPINQGRVLSGVQILAPEQIRDLPYPIVVTTILHQQEIAEQIRRMGLPNDIILLA